MAEKLRVLFLPKWYPNKFDSLDGNFVENHAKAIAPLCSLAVIFVHSDLHATSTFKVLEENNEGISEIRVYFKKPSFYITPINKLISFIRYFRAQLKGYEAYLKTNLKPDITHIHILGRTAPLALLLKYRFNIPFLITEHWSGYHKRSGAYKGILKKWITRFTVKNALTITTVSEDLSKAMQAHHLNGNYEVVPNVIDTITFRAIQAKENKLVRFIHISNLSKVPKNLHQIIQNLNDLICESFDFEFILIGYGEEEQEMLELIHQSPLKSKTTFKGKLAMEEVANELAQADAMLLFSLYENQPVVMLEAFACGCPAIVSNVGGISEIMNPELGIMVESEDNEGFKEALRQLLNREIEFNSEKIRAFATANFSEEVVGQQFLQLYKSALGK